jgi:hypothetical protein
VSLIVLLHNKLTELHYSHIYEDWEKAIKSLVVILIAAGEVRDY